MNIYKWLITLLISLSFISCSGEIDTNPKEIKYDREICELSKMIISVRNYAAQTINPHNGDRFYWDDIGCAILWFDEKGIEWEDEAITYVKDVNTNEWLNAKEAYYTHGAITPMDFGFSAHETKQDGVENYDYNYVRDRDLGKPL